MSRSNYKSYFFCKKVLKLLKRDVFSKKTDIKIKMFKYSTVHNEFSNLNALIHTGKKFINLPTRTLLTTHKIGELVFTRKIYVYPYKKFRKLK